MLWETYVTFPPVGSGEVKKFQPEKNDEPAWTVALVYGEAGRVRLYSVAAQVPPQVDVESPTHGAVHDSDGKGAPAPPEVFSVFPHQHSSPYCVEAYLKPWNAHLESRVKPGR